MTRWSEGSCLWRCCCCGCLLPIILIKICFVLAFTLVSGLITVSVLGLFHLIKGAPQVLYTILMLQTFGIKIKILFAILMLIPIALFLPFCILCCIVVCVVYSVAETTKATMETRFHPLCFGDIPGEVCEALGSLNKGFEDALKEFKTLKSEPLNAGEIPYDFSFTGMFACLFSFIVAIGFFYPLLLLLFVIKFIPFTIRFFIDSWKSFLDSNDKSGCAWLSLTLLFAICNVFLPGFLLLVLVAGIFHGLACVCYVFYVCYDYDFLTAIKYLLATFHRYDGRTNKYILGQLNRGDVPLRSALDCCCVTCTQDMEVIPYVDAVMGHDR